MSKQIWKYVLQQEESQELTMPKQAEILTAQIQNGTLCVWALVDIEAAKEKRIIEIIGTGHAVDNSRRKYINTIQFSGGSLVYHIFEFLY